MIQPRGRSPEMGQKQLFGKSCEALTQPYIAPCGIGNVVAKPLMAQLMGYDVSIGYTYGGHGLVLHSARQIGITYAILLLPERITAEQRRVIIYDHPYTVKISFVEWVKCCCIQKEILNEHRVCAAGKVQVRIIYGVLSNCYRYQVVVDSIVGMPVKSAIARQSGGVYTYKYAIASIAPACRHSYIHIHRVYLVLYTLLGWPPV